MFYKMQITCKKSAFMACHMLELIDSILLTQRNLSAEEVFANSQGSVPQYRSLAVLL